MKCNAGWFELNISAPDNQVSACCYYSGSKDQWSDEYRALDSYWNSANFQQLRHVNIQGTTQSGCESCHFFRSRAPETQYFAEFSQVDENASPLQQANWRLALQEFESNREILTAKPLRYYVDFGFACNLSCIQCHQVPRRKTNGRQVSFEVLYKWREHFKSALEVCVIGGEPFALVEALKFIRAFVEDEELKDVRLTIFTNGTLHHRHMETLIKKRKLSLAVSLDSMGDAYEYIRVDGKWDQVERNVLDFIETGKRLNLDWKLSTTSGLFKTGIPKLPEFAEWCGRNKIPAMFYEIISARGVERAVADENMLAHPLLVRQIPGWKDYFTKAADIYRRYNMSSEAGSLEYFQDLIEKKLQIVALGKERLDAVAKSDQWSSLFDQDVRQLVNLVSCMYGTVTQPPLAWRKTGWLGGRYLVFRPTHLNDHLVTYFADLPAGSGNLCVQMTCWWPAGIGDANRCLVNFQDQNFASKWDVDFERTLDGGVVQRNMILTEESKQFRLIVYAPDAVKEAVLPTRVKIEFRYDETMPIQHHQNELVQINAAG
ncbi:MAG TPA: radical SAM protein [Terriglobales bacterium]|jgi:hypothetical protein|nr:radical SAM protein [Terriglobales bacterium]